MLWDLIRDFFVEHVFGGCNSNGLQFFPTFGEGRYLLDGDYEYEIIYGNSLYYQLDKDNFYNVSFSDWLSTTATIISITIIVTLCCMFVYKIIKLIGGLIR